MDNSRQGREARHEAERRMLPFLIEFVKYVTVFVGILALALLTLHFASAAMA